MASSSEASGKRKGFTSDFDSLLTGLKRTESGSTMSKAQAESSTLGRPAMRFHEAEDVGDSKYVEQWEKTIDNLLKSDIANDAAEKQTRRFVNESKETGTMIGSANQGVVVVDKHSRVVAEKYLNADGTTQAEVEALDKNMVRMFQTEAGKKVTLRAHVHVERIEETLENHEPSSMALEDLGDEEEKVTDRDGNSLDDENDVSNEYPVGEVSRENEDEDSDGAGESDEEEDEESEMAKLMEHIRRLEAHLDPSQAVLSQVISSSVAHSRKNDKRRGLIISIVVFLLGILAGVIILAVRARFGYSSFKENL